MASQGYYSTPYSDSLTARGVPYYFSDKVHYPEDWLDQAMKDIEERMNERPPLDRWAAHGSTGSPREVPPRAKIPLTSEGREPQKPKFLGIPEREGRK